MSQLIPVAEKMFAGRTFKMFMLPPLDSHDLLLDVAKMLGPSVGNVLDALLKQGDKELKLEQLLDMDLNGEFFAKISKQLFAALDKEIVRKVIASFRTVTHVDNRPLDAVFDAIFTGKLGDMYQWLLWGMRVQWAGSFGALASVADGRGAEENKGL